MLRRPPRIAIASATLLSTCSLHPHQSLRTLHSHAPESPEPPAPQHGLSITRYSPGAYRRLDHRPCIDPSSLKQSLDNVREANRAALIRKIYQDGHVEILHPAEPSLLPPKKQKTKHRPLKRHYDLSQSILLDTTLNDPPANPQPLKRQWRPDDTTSVHLTQPWLGQIVPPANCFTPDEALTSEIEAFGRYMTPSKQEQTVIHQTVHEIQQVIASIDNDLKLELIGSRASGLAMPLSDLDFNIFTKEGRLDDIVDRNLSMQNLRRLKTRLSRTHQFRGLFLVQRARVPIIRGFHQRTGLEIQIQQTTNSYNSTQHVKMFLKEYPTLRALFVVVRMLLTMRGLSDGSKGGLSSYPLVNMILASLKFDEQHARPVDAGNQLLSFLKMYAEIDFRFEGLSVTPPKLLRKPSIRDKGISSDLLSDDSLEWAVPNPGFPVGMYLRDPADPSNDLGRTCQKIRLVQATFLAAKQALEESRSRWNYGRVDEERKSLLRFLIGDYTRFELDRSSLEGSLLK